MNYLQPGVHTDAGHAEAGPSTGGFTIDMGDTTVHAASGKHHATTIATTDVEMYELQRSMATGLAVRDFCGELGLAQALPMPYACDNSGAVQQGSSSASHKRSLYMARRIRFVQDAVDRRAARIYAVKGEHNRADILTKLLSTRLFKQFRHMVLNVRDVAPQVAALARGCIWRFSATQA